MVKHIILTDAALDSADVLLVSRGTLPQTIGSLTAGDYTVRDTSSPVAGTVTEAAAPPDPGENWYDSRAMIDLDYENDRAYVNGTAYGSIAAARAAGAVAVNAHGDDTVAISGLGASYVLAATGTGPSSVGNSYLAALDDGTNSQLVYVGTATYSSSASAGAISGSSLIALPSLSGSGIGNLRLAIRCKSGAHLISRAGEVAQTSTTSGIASPTLLIAGNRSAGDRRWMGTIGRILLISVNLTDSEVHALLA